jgi:hypothetical protein
MGPLELCVTFYAISALFGLIVATGLQLSNPRLTMLNLTRNNVTTIVRAKNEGREDRSNDRRKAA